MQFSEKLYELRREKGYSQEQLADLLSISRQAISKWEAGSAMPELEKLIAVSDLFGVSVDYLVRDNAAAKEENKTVVTVSDNTAVMQELAEIKSTVTKRQYSKSMYEYEYKSKATLFGLPVLHIHHKQYGVAVAKGIVAIGDVALGAVAIGGIGIGLFSLGGLSLGMLLSLGGLAAGIVSLGGVAVGVLSFGGLAIGVYSLGGCAVGAEVAVGGAAFGRIAVGEHASGEFVMNKIQNTSAQQIIDFIKQHLR